jgi:hypothetical protein
MTSSDKPQPQASTPPSQEQQPGTRRYPVRSLDELKKRGVPISNDLLISPVPGKVSKE